MPHLFVNRPRLHDLTSGSDDLKAQFRWETINAVFYKVGGVVFIVGRVLFENRTNKGPSRLEARVRCSGRLTLSGLVVPGRVGGVGDG